MRRGGRGRGLATTDRKGNFNPDDSSKVKHTQFGVWDFYEEIHPELEKLPASATWAAYYDAKESFPYLWQMMKDISLLRDVWGLMAVYLGIEVAKALVPAIRLWFSGQLLSVVQRALDTKTVDTGFLIRLTVGRLVLYTVNRRLVHYGITIGKPLKLKMRQFYAGHIFHALSRLDIPTRNDPAINRQIQNVMGAMSPNDPIPWKAVNMFIGLASLVVNLVSQTGVLVSVLKNHRDGYLFAGLYIIQGLVGMWWGRKVYTQPNPVWAATTHNEDYVRMQGMKLAVQEPDHRNEMVAGNLSTRMLSEFKNALSKVGDDSDFHDALRWHRTITRTAKLIPVDKFLEELPQILFVFRAIEYPANVPVSLTTLHIIHRAADAFTENLREFYDQTMSISETVGLVRTLYSIINIPNRILDGEKPFPEDQQTLSQGVSLEFRNVSFRYPGSDIYALRNVSFQVDRGQLCVIVGSNGSGKSTVLKLIARLYDPTEGDIFLDGLNLKTLKLADIRRAMAILFQDFSVFPLSIKENIALGDPDSPLDEDKVRQAARLGGAENIMEKLPESYNTYLERPVQDYYGGIPSGTKTLFGRKVDYGRLQARGAMRTSPLQLSGGQMQRIALSRTFMRSLSFEPTLGLLLFDEPSASLDPTAEHDLFQRLVALRGSRTMLFSSHRFGNLTRHADLILYMNDSLVMESGTHSDLLQRNGDYARIWSLQAQAFVS